MRKYAYFLAFVAIIAMSACGNNESTTEKGTNDSTSVSVDTTAKPIMDSTVVSTNSTK